MQRVKKPKKSIVDRPTKTPMMYVTQTNYVNLAVMVRTLQMVYDWNREQLDEFCEAYLSLIDEFGSKRTTVSAFIRDTEELTGINVKTLLDEVVQEKKRND